ncbi:hypothetical protein COV17_00160 [Candidatus Woesearchaeota archaeon CG10_big_fil_rev_8_21_14_0_10_36_11]|nr:MAG: hypothetical protein COV17_00160 [Candidatus Woesearchaeota archaeon CG10_big_fil_rev_8_21_14_0_10_36_11]
MVEPIKELRVICQKKEQLYDKKGEDNTSDQVQEYIYDRFLRAVSIYITKIVLYTSLTSNQVSIISMIVGLFAGFLFSFANPWYWVAGFVGLQLFHFLDAVDGEVARYRKVASPIGKYFDLLAHGIVIAAFYTGMIFGIFNATQGKLVFIIGFICVASFLLTSLSVALRKFLFYQYAITEKKYDLMKKTSKVTNVHSFKYFIKRLFGFDGFAFIVLFFTLLDIIFSSTFSFRYLFLILSAIIGPLIFIKSMWETSKMRKLFFS